MAARLLSMFTVFALLLALGAAGALADGDPASDILVKGIRFLGAMPQNEPTYWSP